MSGPEAQTGWVGEERGLLEEEMEGEAASLPWQSSLQYADLLGGSTQSTAGHGKPTHSQSVVFHTQGRFPQTWLHPICPSPFIRPLDFRHPPGHPLIQPLQYPSHLPFSGALPRAAPRATPIHQNRSSPSSPSSDCCALHPASLDPPSPSATFPNNCSTLSYCDYPFRGTLRSFRTIPVPR